jgi:hypothetical protein
VLDPDPVAPRTRAVPGGDDLEDAIRDQRQITDLEPQTQEPVHRVDEPPPRLVGTIAVVPLLLEVNGKLERPERLAGVDLEGVGEERARQLTGNAEIGVHKFAELVDLGGCIAGLQDLGEGGGVDRTTREPDDHVRSAPGADQKGVNHAELNDGVKIACEGKGSKSLVRRGTFLYV